MQCTQLRPRDVQLRCKQAIEARTGRIWNRKFDLQMRPVRSIAQQLLSDVRFPELVDPLRLPPESVEIECLSPDPIGIVGLQSFKLCRLDVANIPAFEDRAIPGFVARRALVDEPCIEPAAVGIEPCFVAALEGSKVSASAACDPWSRCDSRNNGPADLKCIAHTGLVFRSEVHQDGSAREPLGHGMALCGDEELTQRGCTWH